MVRLADSTALRGSQVKPTVAHSSAKPRQSWAEQHGSAGCPRHLTKETCPAPAQQRVHLHEYSRRSLEHAQAPKIEPWIGIARIQIEHGDPGRLNVASAHSGISQCQSDRRIRAGERRGAFRGTGQVVCKHEQRPGTPRAPQPAHVGGILRWRPRLHANSLFCMQFLVNRIQEVALGTDQSLKDRTDRRDMARDALTDAAYQAILAEIFGGGMPPGEPVSEVELARRLGMSRTPVHLAVRELVRDGLLTQEPNRRPVSRAFTADDAREIYEMRLLLECEAAALAAQRLDRPALQALVDACARLRRSLKSKDILERWADLDESFHRELALASGNQRLAQDIFRYRLVHRGFNTIRFTADLVPQALAEHERVLAAIDDRNPDEARKAMQVHLREWQAYYVRSFAEHDPQTLARTRRRSEAAG